MILNAKDWEGKQINVSEPWGKVIGNTSIQGENRAKSHLIRGIIFGVPYDITDQQIADEVKSISARRLFKWSDGQKQPTENVVLTYKDELLYRHMSCSALCDVKSNNTFLHL